MTEKEKTKFADVYTSDWDSIGNLSELLNREFKILRFEQIQDASNDVVVVTIENPDTEEIEKRHTFGKVLIKQLKNIETVLRTKPVWAKLVKVKNYYTFE